MTQNLRDKRGVLLIMAGVPAEAEPEFESWWDEEHLPQRLECPGLVNGSRWVALEGEPKHLTLFELRAVSAVDTEAYRNISQHPTERTRSIVAQIDVRRLVFAERSAVGDGSAAARAGALMLVTFDLPEEVDQEYENWFRTHDRKLLNVPGVLRLRRFRSAEEGPAHCAIIEFAESSVIQSDAYREGRTDPERERLARHFADFRRNVYVRRFPGPAAD